ncbi:DsbA family oxidoreductase [Dactylosporangium fulvum]|uniref:DsbA family oxidoreductase n=1 Tax=Dactylosporangium fulvum TaxID=53359 RepID=A0ABY5W9B9_9ACTN|nr:DsbA family oxidoreductase [Dactylosporangium fulvum]UWP86692.1 DsbA family oxidoreductase [Dactylosporangium fulvum]
MAGAASDRAAGHLVIDVWSDVMCPWCYMGTTLLVQALERFPHAQQTQIRHHSYQLMPDLAPDTAVGLTEYLVRQRGFQRQQIEAMNAQIAARGAAIGLEYRSERAIAANTRAAHQLIHFAAKAGRQHEMVQRLFRAYFTEGLSVGDHTVLAGLAAETGLDPAAAAQALATGVFDDDVQADIRQAQQLGISGVPFFIFGGKYALSGGQPVEAFLQALNTAWDEAPGTP